jgi:flavin reductase (DIM6/NTAB) family NADH-FMN oxidoreductase RutF
MHRPWNRVTTPVYSLVTFDDAQVWNANICTYVTGISMEPKHFLIALDPKSRTFANFKKSGHGYLQVLSEKNLPQVEFLGKKSGTKISKYEALKPVLKAYQKKVELLPHILGFMRIETVKALGVAEGDHELFVVAIKASHNLSSESPLHLQHLIEAGLILRPRA